MKRYIPILDWLPHYKPSWLRADLIAGLTIMALLVPEGMAYAELAGVPPQTAFYAAPAGLLLYAIFGSSRHLVVAVSSAIAVMSASIISQIGPATQSEYIVLTAGLAILAGVVAVIAGLLKLGRIARFFSHSVLTGFVAGLAVLIMVKQIPKVLGIEGAHGNTWQRLVDAIRHIGDAHLETMMVGVGIIVLMLTIERWLHRIPAALVALVVGILAVTVFDLAEHGVHIVGEIPGGLAAPRVPDLSWGDLRALLPGAAALALVMFAEANGPGRTFATKHGYRIDENQELIGLGVANAGAGLFQGFSIGASLSKSAASEAAGGRTQVAGIIAAVATGLVALFLTPLFENLPEAALGAIVIVAVSSMVKVGYMRRLLTLRSTDFWIALIAFLGVLTFEEVLYGLLAAVLASMLALVLRTSSPQASVVGRLPGTLEYRSIVTHPEAIQSPGVIILRPDEAVFFANATSIKDSVRTAGNDAGRPIHTLVLDLELTNDLDVPGADMIGELNEELAADERTLVLAGVYDPVSDLLARTGVIDSIGRDRIYSNVPSAVLALIDDGHDGITGTDLSSLVVWLDDLSHLVTRHEADLTAEQRAKLLEAMAELERITTEDTE